MKKLFTFLLVGVFSLSTQAQSNITITSSCDNISICNSSSDCSNMLVELTATATTDCSMGSTLTFNYQLDLNDDGSFEFAGANSTASENVPNGNHRIVFTITDQCNTSVMCDYLFEVKDCSAPVPVCIFGIATTVMPQTGSVTIWATDFESNNSYDNCSDYNDLKFSFSEDVNDTSMEIVCDMISNDPLIPIIIYVTDEAGNKDFCSTFINVQDPNEVCGGGTSTTTSTVTSVTTQNCQLEGMNYDVNGLTFPVSTFPINTLNVGDVVTPNMTSNALNGVTTYDLVLISKHILNVQPFTESWQLIAADANQNGTVTTLDGAIFFALIIQNITQLPTGDSWVFDPSSFTYDGVMTEFEFLAIKLGDVNNTAVNPNCFQAPSIDTRTLGTLNLTAKNKNIRKGETFTITTFAQNYENILGGQFTIDFDVSALDFQSVEGNESIELMNENFGLSRTNEGLILCSWHTPFTKDLSSDDAFYNITFTAKKDGKLSDYLSINSQELIAESYAENDGQTEFWNIELNFENEVHNNTFTISPNPFSEKTTFTFSLEKEGKIDLQIFDTNGRLVFSQNKNMNEEENQIEIQKENLLSNGIYFYKIKTDSNVKTGKIISQ